MGSTTTTNSTIDVAYLRRRDKRRLRDIGLLVLRDYRSLFAPEMINGTEASVHEFLFSMERSRDEMIGKILELQGQTYTLRASMPNLRLDELVAERQAAIQAVKDYVSGLIAVCPHRIEDIREVPVGWIRYQMINDTMLPEVRVCTRCGYAECRTSCGWNSNGPFAGHGSATIKALDREELDAATTWHVGESETAWVHDKRGVFVLRGRCTR